MYGLPQAGHITNGAHLPHLAGHGYTQGAPTPGLFTHTSCLICFSLVVNDFGVKYIGREHAEHLCDVFASKYKITTDWDSDIYLGPHRKWDST
jgi:hypothetical protein